MTYSNSAALLGDPNFPQILIAAPQGERIIRCQDLYKRYSRLDLTQSYDRPTAIDGMQQRLLRTMNVKGGFGMFDAGKTRGLLRRSLLWCRGADTVSLTRIEFPAERGVPMIPSWSWMAYAGGIDYLELDFDQIDWLDIKSPWSHPNREKTPALTARARDYTQDIHDLSEELLVFDVSGAPLHTRGVCLVLGVQKGNKPDGDRRHYVLFVIPTANIERDGRNQYERVGTGYLPGRCIANDGPLVNIY